VDENLLDAVIGLPEKLFFGTGIPAAILVCRRNRADRNILFIDASREFKDGKNQNQLSEDNVAKIIQTYRARKDVDKYAHLATIDEIKENEYNLNIPRYVDTFEDKQQIDLAAVLAERKTLKAELFQIEAEMDGYLKELGYGA
jgi:type I restriction enzyme M protein